MLEHSYHIIMYSFKNLYPCKNDANERFYLSSICVLWVDVNIEFHSFRQTVFMNTIIPISNILMGFRRNRYTRTSTTFLLVIIETVSVHEYFCAYLTFVWRTSLLQVIKIMSNILTQERNLCLLKTLMME